MRIRIPWKLTLVFSILIILAFGTLYFYLNSRLDNYLENKIQQTVKQDLALCKIFVSQDLTLKNGNIDATGLAKRIGAALGMRAGDDTAAPGIGFGVS